MNFGFLDIMMRSRNFLLRAEVRRIPFRFFGLLLHQSRAITSKVSSSAVCGSAASCNRFSTGALTDSPRLSSAAMYQIRGYSGRSFSSDTSLNSSSSSARIARLESRSLLLVSGKDSAVFLQGLITNDIHLLDASEEGGPKSIYAMLLNTQGRVMYDVIIYKFAADTFLIEHDTALQTNLIRHLKMYKLRKTVELDSDVKFDVYACFGNENIDNAPQPSTGTIGFPDPRLSLMGARLYVRSANKNWNQEMKDCETVDEGQYRKFRYVNGIAEGKTDLPPGECFPLESNLDYLSGVHFNKGCYLGQELTARTQHTGVVRKRIMPITISGDGMEDGQDTVLPAGSGISTAHGGKTVSVGKLRSHLGANGLAVLRISEALASPTLDLALDGQVYQITAIKPEWWPDPD